MIKNIFRRIAIRSRGERLLLLLLLSSGCLHAADTLVVGNNTYDGTMTNNKGPKGDANVTASFVAGANTIVIPRATSLQPSNIKLHISSDTGGNGNLGMIYCAAGGFGGPIYLYPQLLSSGYTYNNHKLFKTNVQGLYYTMHMYHLWSYATSSNLDFYIGDNGQASYPLDDLHSTSCSDGKTSDYQTLGGLVSDIDIEFYNDQTFNPNTTGSISLVSNGTPYLYYLHNPNPGGALSSGSRYIYQSVNLSNVYLSSPTCTTAILTGKTVTKDTVSLGEYSPQQIIDGATGVPFSIELQGCYRVSNIEVKLMTGAPAASASLLGNSLTSNNAGGVGVEIKGQSNSHYAEIAMKPNDASSVYKAYNDGTDSTNGIIGSGGSGTPASQILNFTATLKQDGNQQIRGGDFKAVGVFSMTYP
ncbi:fimbrial protein [[Enterobacter] lignolyticus]|uniref:Fimbrial protein n=1 Tax=[Enterobacter] lignolyticus TaxID=1334193 RepID=A0A806X2U5_9ENTR|nr:fimbrial protein [[Enterobacter] lignolyticus]ALR75488.1 fimbrial protein [[Enterobacter] lignolyticus]